MRSRRSRPWIAPRRCCRCFGERTAYPRLRPPRHHDPVRRVGGRHRPHHRGRLLPRHRNGEFLAFLKLVAKAHPRVQLHVVCDNYATHSHPTVKAWLARHPRITMHFTPTSASWMNLVEIFFGIITRQAIRRGTFASVPDLIGAIRTSSTPKRTLRTVHLDQNRRPDPHQGHRKRPQTRDTRLATWQGPATHPWAATNHC